VRSPRILPALGACGLGVAAALLVSCGSSSGKLIPVAKAGPLQSDFEAVAQEAESGNGDCYATEAAIAKTQQDFSALPASVDAGLRETLRQGIANLREHALALCAQPAVQTAATSTTAKTTSTTHTTAPTTPTTPTPTTTATTPPATTPTTSSPGGGTPAPGEPAPGAGSGQGGGTGIGEGGGACGAPGGAGPGQEVGK
jgi:hypothetical protein